MESHRRAGTRTSCVEPVEPRLQFAAGIPRPDHVVIVVEENRPFDEIIGYEKAPYINSLAARGALMTNYRGITYPSQPNYLALFSGSTQGVTGSGRPSRRFTDPSLGGELIRAGYDFAGYSEDMPSVGYDGTSYDGYRRRHNPWVNFTDVPASDNLPFTHFPDEDDYDELPDLAFVIPEQEHNMHDGPREDGDAWLRENLDPYVRWAQDNNSLFILTWDEDDRDHDNHIVTLFVGPMVKPGRYNTRYDHYDLLRTLEDMFDLPHLGRSADRRGGTPITEVWRPVETGPRVAGRLLFYNNSAYDGASRVADARDDHAIAGDKEALLPGRRADIDNVSTYTRGINGVMVDLAERPSTSSLGIADFTLRVGDGRGNWSAAPSPRMITTRRGAGVGGSDRVTLVWADRAIANQWLQVTVRATSRTGLRRDDVFYFGNLAGETFRASAGKTVLTISADDAAVVRRRFGADDAAAPAAGPDDAWDHNRDGDVDLLDVLAVRANLSRALALFTAAPAAASALLAVPTPAPIRREI
ncbi:MAG TPA: alkaline phosphatase family protein [Tepidisphaeraceae bacterium]|nr:alkaline phosphatase family protein [Tepidisphaeraceae bacterium]